MTNRHTFCSVVIALVSTFAVLAALPSSAVMASSRAHFIHPYLLGPRSGASTLTPAQIKTLARDANKKVIVILKDQFPGLSAVGARHAVRTSSIRGQEASIVAELKHLHAPNVHSYKIINAIKATISRSEASRLRHNPLVRAVVPDATIREPTFSPIAPDVSKKDLAAVRRQAATPTCSYTRPQLTPEALGLTHTAYLNSKVPQAQNYVDGSGVSVAFMADGVDPYNPDFVRPNGSLVFTDVEDFTGEGYFSPSDGAEAFGDASSIAAQANTAYQVNSYLAIKSPTGCHNIKILGVAPGASLMALKVFGANQSGTTSNFVEAIQYAVLHGANVLNQSFGSNPFPDFSEDPVSLADAAAIKAGVTVVSSTGDSGTTGTLGTPSTVPGVIAAAASTSFQGYKQTTYGGFQLSNGKYLSNNISSLSSGGLAQSGLKTPDVLAPGDLGWALCSDDWVLYSGCTNFAGLPSSFQLFGGTSESSPLTSGEAALVIEAYAKTHKALPSPQLVKQIIMSSATDLGEPSYEQGAGLINSLRAVRMAESYKLPHAVGSSLMTSATPLSFTGKAGSTHTYSVTVQNTGTTSTSVRPVVRTIGAPTQNQTSTLQLNQKTDKSFVDEVGVQRSFVAKTFTVPAHSARLDASIAWNVVNHPDSLVRLTLLAPSGAYAAFTLPQDFGPPFRSSGYGHVDVRYPAAGTWQAIIWTKTQSPDTGYTGPVQFNSSTSRWISGGSTSPKSATVAPGGSKTFTISTKLPSKPGEYNANLGFEGKAGAIPVILRTMIPTSNSGGSFSGQLTGGNGRDGAPGQTLNYLFNVPAGRPELSIGITVPDVGNNLEAILINPQQLPVDTQSNINKLDLRSGSSTFGEPISFGKSVQLFSRNPEAGRWQLIFIINDSISGQRVVTPFTGAINFAAPNITATGVPNGGSAKVGSGKTATARITIKNTGRTTKQYFVDPRLNSYGTISLGGGIASSPPWPTPNVYVPPHTKQLVITAEATNGALVDMDCFDASGAAPFGGLGSPDVLAQVIVDPFTHLPVAVMAAKVTGQFPAGFWTCPVSNVGPFPASGAPRTKIALAGSMQTQSFDGRVSTAQGDVYKDVLGLTRAPFKPLTLAPGQSGSITVAITPKKGDVGKTISGTMYVDAMAVDRGYFITDVPDQVGQVSYSYKVTP